MRHFVTLRVNPKLAHAAFLLETPQDETGDDARNLDALRSFLNADGRETRSGNKILDEK